jgi:hypothetical protein
MLPTVTASHVLLQLQADAVSGTLATVTASHVLLQLQADDCPNCVGHAAQSMMSMRTYVADSCLMCSISAVLSVTCQLAAEQQAAVRLC